MTKSNNDLCMHEFVETSCSSVLPTQGDTMPSTEISPKHITKVLERVDSREQCSAAFAQRRRRRVQRHLAEAGARRPRSRSPTSNCLEGKPLRT
jgi:hypothetical protein